MSIAGERPIRRQAPTVLYRSLHQVDVHAKAIQA